MDEKVLFCLKTFILDHLKTKDILIEITDLNS
jgi:hypothetical protein